MLTFDLDEEVTEEMLENEKLTYTALIDVIKKEEDNPNMEEYINDTIIGNNGITSKLSKFDKRLIVKGQNNKWKCDMLKLVKYIYYYQKDYNILLNLKRTSYRTVRMFDDYQISNENKIFAKIENEIKNHIDKENGNEEFTNKAEKSLNDFTDIFNMIASASGRVCKEITQMNYMNGKKEFLENYTKNIEEYFNEWEKRVNEEEPENDYGVFEIFYQIIKYNSYNGANATQIHISELILSVLKKGIRPITTKMKSKFNKYTNQDPILIENVQEFIKKNTDDIVEIICDEDMNKDKVKKDLTKEKNLKRIQAGIELSCKITRDSKKEIEKLKIYPVIVISCCRALIIPIVKTKNGYKKITDKVFTADGYYPPEEEAERKLSLAKDIDRYINQKNDRTEDSNKPRTQSGRLVLELTNMCNSQYNNGDLEYFKYRFRNEIAIDKFKQAVIAKCDYGYIDKFICKNVDDSVEACYNNEFQNNVDNFALYEEFLKRSCNFILSDEFLSGDYSSNSLNKFCNENNKSNSSDKLDVENYYNNEFCNEIYDLILPDEYCSEKYIDQALEFDVTCKDPCNTYNRYKVDKKNYPEKYADAIKNIRTEILMRYDVNKKDKIEEKKEA